MMINHLFIKYIFILHFLAAGLYPAAGQFGFSRILDEGYYGQMNIDDIAYADDGIVINGNVYVDSIGRWGLFVCKMDTSGHVIWARTYLDPLDETDVISNSPTRMVYTSDQGYLIPVSFFHRGTDGIVRLDSMGQIEFGKEFPNLEKTIITFDAIEVDSFFYIVGLQQRLGFDFDIFLRKLDWHGNEIWLKFYGESEYDEYSLTIHAFNSLHLAFGTVKTPFPGDGTINTGTPWKLIVDTSGQIVNNWLGQLNDPRVPAAGRMAFTPDNDWLSTSLEWKEVAHKVFSSISVLTFMDSSNTNQIWKKKIGSFAPVCYNIFHDIIYDPISNSFIVAGQTCTPDNRQRGRIIKYSLEGDLIWDVAALEIDEIESSHIISGVCISPSGAVYAAGYIDYDTPSGSNFGWVIKITKDGCLDTLCTLTSLQTQISSNKKILISPNPVSTTLHIVWDPGLDLTECDVYDIHGRFHGRHILTGTSIDITLDLAPGMYFCILRNKVGKGFTERFIKL